MPNTSREWKNRGISGKLYVQVPIQTWWHIPIPALTYPPNLLFRYSASFTVVPCCFLLRELHRRIFSLLPLAEAEKERQRTLRVPRIEQPRLGCSIFRRRTNVSLLCFSVTDGEPMLWYFFQWNFFVLSADLFSHQSNVYRVFPLFFKF